MELVIEDRFMSVKEAAKVFGIQPAHLYELINQGVIPCTILKTKRVTYKTMIKFIEESKGKNYSNPKEVREIMPSDLLSEDKDETGEKKGA